MSADTAGIIVTHASAVEQVVLAESTLQIHQDGHALGSGLALVGGSLEPRQDGPPEHVHRRLVEIFHVVEGTLRLHSCGAHVDVAVGGTASVPVGVPHTYSNPHDAPVRFLIATSSSDVPDLFRALRDTPPASQRAVMEQHDTYVPEAPAR